MLDFMIEANRLEMLEKTRKRSLENSFYGPTGESLLEKWGDGRKGLGSMGSGGDGIEDVLRLQSGKPSGKEVRVTIQNIAKSNVLDLKRGERSGVGSSGEVERPMTWSEERETTCNMGSGGDGIEDVLRLQSGKPSGKEVRVKIQNIAKSNVLDLKRGERLRSGSSGEVERPMIWTEKREITLPHTLKRSCVMIERLRVLRDGIKDLGSKGSGGDGRVSTLRDFKGQGSKGSKGEVDSGVLSLRGRAHPRKWVLNSSFRCNCGKTFASSSSLKRHQQTVVHENVFSGISHEIPDENVYYEQEFEAQDQIGLHFMLQSEPEPSVQTKERQTTAKNFKCLSCQNQSPPKDVFFTRMDSVSKHFKKFHPKEELCYQDLREDESGVYFEESMLEIVKVEPIDVYEEVEGEYLQLELDDENGDSLGLSEASMDVDDNFQQIWDNVDENGENVVGSGDFLGLSEASMDVDDNSQQIRDNFDENGENRPENGDGKKNSRAFFLNFFINHEGVIGSFKQSSFNKYLDDEEFSKHFDNLAGKMSREEGISTIKRFVYYEKGKGFKGNSNLGQNINSSKKLPHVNKVKAIVKQKVNSLCGTLEVIPKTQHKLTRLRNPEIQRLLDSLIEAGVEPKYANRFIFRQLQKLKN